MPCIEVRTPPALPAPNYELPNICFDVSEILPTEGLQSRLKQLMQEPETLSLHASTLQQMHTQVD